MMEWGQKSKPQKFPRASNKKKIPGPKINPQKIPCQFPRTTRLGYVGTTTNLQIVLNTQKHPYLNPATPKNTWHIFLPKNIPESKISNPKQSFDHPRHLKSGVPPPPPPPWILIRQNQTVLDVKSRGLVFKFTLTTSWGCFSKSYIHNKQRIYNF